MTKSIFLVGPMGAGKTAVGRQLARELDLQFCDSDIEIQRRTGVDISFIFEKEGEAGFRKREKEVIDFLTRQPGVVLATGGGSVLDGDSRRRLRERGIVIYLRTAIAQQLRRTRFNRNRPLLDNDNPEQILKELARHRETLYQDLATLVVDTDGRKVAAVSKEIANWYRRDVHGGNGT